VLRWRARAPAPARAVALWQRLCRRCAAAGCAREPWEGPRDFAVRAAAAWPARAAAIEAAAAAYIACRYGAPADPAAALRRLRDAVREAARR